MSDERRVEAEAWEGPTFHITVITAWSQSVVGFNICDDAPRYKIKQFILSFDRNVNPDYAAFVSYLFVRSWNGASSRHTPHVDQSIDTCMAVRA